MFKKNRKAGNNSEDNSSRRRRENYKEKIQAYRDKNIYRAILIIIVIAGIFVIARLLYVRHVYTGYEVKTECERTGSTESNDIRLGDSILTYSKDGAHLYDAKGNILWNQTYEIQDLKIATEDGTLGIANYNGRDIYILNEEKKLCQITTTMPIRNLCVAENGTSTAVLYDTDVTYLNTYNSDGEILFSGQTHMAGSGYPAAIALSPNGKLLCVGYIYVDAGTVKTTVAFYNFGSVGDNYTDYLVSGFDYTDIIVPQVGFLNNSLAYAISDDRIMFYYGDEQPSVKSEYLLDQEILSVYEENGYLGVVFASDKDDYRYKLNVYNGSAELEGSYYFDLDYTDIFFEKKDFVVYNESNCLIETYEGRVKFNGSFDKSVKVMLPTGKAYCYVIVNDTSIETIQMN